MFTLHRLQPQEGERLKAVRLRALQEAPYAFGKTYAEEAAQDQAFWAGRLANPKVATWVAERDWQDVGLVTAAPVQEGPPGAIGLYGMWVDPTVRGLGVGAELIRHLIEWARGERYQQILLGVVESNRHAIELYTRLGFTATGARGDHPSGACERHFQRLL